MNYIMSEPIPIKKEEEEKSSFFFSWYKKEKEVEKKVEEEEIFEMDDDELPPNVSKEESKNGLDAKLSDSDEKEDDDEDVEEEYVSDYEEQDEYCFGYPCNNHKFYGYCKRCQENSICQLICESFEEGMNDMKNDIKKLWEKDVVKVWTAFLTVCYFNIPNQAMFAGFMYYINEKFKEQEERMMNSIQVEKLDDVDSDDDNKPEIKKCV